MNLYKLQGCNLGEEFLRERHHPVAQVQSGGHHHLRGGRLAVAALRPGMAMPALARSA